MEVTLPHRFANECEKVIYPASCCLIRPKKNSSQTKKEALALIFAVQKFHRFIHGRHFTLRTDHKPLLAILGSKKRSSGLQCQPSSAMGHDTAQLQFHYRVYQHKEFRPSGRSFTPRLVTIIDTGGQRDRLNRC
ncbi:hypothetical protein RB195_022413 [Necator americanus]|uniref:Reverse transcriptase RNase H-like domain-containing protein n=1 Tax=Necator americanus TaxID=51031 RepID=A0ABR1EF70_NECAM